MGYLLAIAILGAILFGPAIAIMRSKGPPLTTRILWSLLSVSVAVVLLVGAPFIQIIGGDQLYAQFMQFSHPFNPYFLGVLYGFPVATYIAFKLLVMSKHQYTDEQKTRSEIEYNGSDIAAIRSKYVQLKLAFYSFILVSGAATLAGSMTQQDWPMNFAPFFLLTYVLSAIAIGRLANKIGRRGQYWGVLAIVCPIMGAVIGYVVIGRSANQLINQIRWKTLNN